MGVQGLATLLDTHRRIYREVRFSRSRLVIDGCNLLYRLYFTSDLDEIHGGEYAAFENLTENFIRALRECSITPYVVLDGGSDPTDKKLETVRQGAKDQIRRAHRAALGCRKQNILPLFTKLVFKQTLVRLEVPVAQCYGEADQEIAALANEWQCPVLSNDSDFYIFSLRAGMLPISHFQWEAVEQRSIPCLSYNTSSFCVFFSIQPNLLPTFGTLAGNDYVKLQRMGSSINWAEFCPTGSETPSRLEGLLCWLRGYEQPRDALEAVLGMMGELSSEKKAEVLQGLWLGMEEYHLPPSSLKKFFIHELAPTFSAMGEAAARVPAWMCLPLTQARLSPDVLNVLLLQRMSLNILADHADMPSACLTSRPLRQVLYGLLLGQGRSRVVEERDREGLCLTFVPVQPTVRGLVRRHGLSFLEKAKPSERLQVILDALGTTEASLNQVPPQLRLPVAVTCYWLQNARPSPDMMLLKALLLGLSRGDTGRHRPAVKTHCEWKLDVAVAHSFNQWQVCLKDSITLNLLLGCPLPDPQVARLYQGTLVHQLVHRMRSRQKIKPFPQSDRSSVKQYKTMLSAIHQLHSLQTLTSSDTRNKVTDPQQQQPLDNLTANLQQLFFQYEDDEAATEVMSAVTAHEADQGLLLSVRSRFRTKGRNNRSKNPELATKEECRGWDLL